MRNSDDDAETDLFSAAKDRWKRMRTLMNPTFTTSKIKLLMPLMQKCSSRLMEAIEKNTDRELNISKYEQNMQYLFENNLYSIFQLLNM